MPDTPLPPAPKPGPDAAARLLCAGADLAEKGRAVVFDVLLWGQRATAFALRFDGKVVAYVNRCVHVPVEMDWQRGEFLDADRAWIICSIHGAAYEPATGRCAAGPCGRGRLRPVRVEERDAQVYWYPCADIRPVEPAELPRESPPHER